MASCSAQAEPAGVLAAAVPPSELSERERRFRGEAPYGSGRLEIAAAPLTCNGGGEPVTQVTQVTAGFSTAANSAGSDCRAGITNDSAQLNPLSCALPGIQPLNPASSPSTMAEPSGGHSHRDYVRQKRGRLVPPRSPEHRREPPPSIAARGHHIEGSHTGPQERNLGIPHELVATATYALSPHLCRKLPASGSATVSRETSRSVEPAIPRNSPLNRRHSASIAA